MEPRAPCELLRLDRVDDDVADRRQLRREGGRDDVRDGVEEEALALPGQVVVVGDDGDAGLGDQFGQGQPERQVERDRQRVLDDEQLEVEGGAELVQLGLEHRLELVDPPRRRAGRTYGE